MTAIFIPSAQLDNDEKRQLAEAGASHIESKSMSGDLIEAGFLLTGAAGSVKILSDFLLSRMSRSNTISLKLDGKEISISSRDDVAKLMEVAKSSLG